MQALLRALMAGLEAGGSRLSRGFEAEKRRLFDALLLTWLALLLCALSLSAFMLLLWWALEPSQRLVALACVCVLLLIMAGMLMWMARVRLSRE